MIETEDDEFVTIEDNKPKKYTGLTPKQKERKARIKAEREARKAEREAKANMLEERAKQSAIAMTLDLVEIELLDEGHRYAGKHGTQSEYANHKCRGPLCRYAASRGRRGSDKINLDTVRGRIDEACDDVIRALIDDHHRIYEAKKKEFKAEDEREDAEDAKAADAHREGLVEYFKVQREASKKRSREWEAQALREEKLEKERTLRQTVSQQQAGEEADEAGRLERQRKREAILARQRRTGKRKERNEQRE